MSTHFNPPYLSIRDLSEEAAPVVTSGHHHYYHQQQEEELEHRYKVNSIIENLHAVCDHTRTSDTSATQTSTAMRSLLQPGT